MVTPEQTEHPVRLDILIIGAGIAGLGAAAALRRAGHDVTLLERASEIREAGFMVSFGPNGTRVLKSLDFDFENAQAVPIDYIEQYDGRTLERQTQVDVRNIEELYGHEMFTFYRPDLQNELKRLALSTDDRYPTPNLILNSSVVEVDIDLATVKLADGTIHTADLIVGADGERSTIRQAFDEPGSLIQAPFKIFRTLIPSEVIKADPKAAEILNLSRRKFTMFNNGLPSISWFEAHNGTPQDLELGYPIKSKQDRKAVTGDKAAVKEAMLKEARPYHPDLIRILQKAQNVSDWEIYQATPLAHWYQSKAVLIGDAAHSMLPTTGQGGCMTMEDIGTLTAVLNDLKSKDQVQERLEIFEKLRKGRAEAVQAMSRIKIGKEEEFFRKFGPFQSKGVNIENTVDHLNFLFGYDAVAEAEIAVKKSQQYRAQL